MPTVDRLLKSLGNSLVREARRALRTATRPLPHPSVGRRTPASSPTGYPGDFTGVPVLSYQPVPDDNADPGEVVWAWVPYEEDHSRGKDRPVLVIGRDGSWLLALPMTSQDHDRDARHEASQGRYWCDIGTGEWDREGRQSEVRVNRILRLDPAAVRRIAARLPRERFDEVAREVLRHYG